MTAVRWAAPTALLLVGCFWLSAEVVFRATGAVLRWRERDEFEPTLRQVPARGGGVS